MIYGFQPVWNGRTKKICCCLCAGLGEVDLAWDPPVSGCQKGAHVFYIVACIAQVVGSEGKCAKRVVVEVAIISAADDDTDPAF